MAGTILHRILSRTKLPPAQIDTTTATTTALSDMPQQDTKQRVSFDEAKSSRKGSFGHVPSFSMYNTRKHSYASVREESDVPQSFRTRRLSSESQQPADCLPRRLESYLNLGSVKSKAEDEEAVVDYDSDVTPYSYDGTSYTDEDVGEFPRSKSLEDLPDEILDQIFDLMQMSPAPDTVLTPRADLFSCLLVSRTVHAAALRVLYKHVLIYRSRTFHKLVTSVQQDEALGKLIQTLDFSHYSHMGYGRSRGQTNVTPYLTKENMQLVLSRTTGLKAFLVHEHLDDELDQAVLSALFSIPSLRAVDLTACSSEKFASAFSTVWAAPEARRYTQIRRLCLHECTTLKPKVFERVLPQLSQLTHLDLAHTRVNDTALLSIAPTAQLTHLNLERCTQITGDAAVHFLTEHPAACSTMTWLNLNADASRYRLLSAENVDRLLPALPSVMRSLNLGGAKITSRHVPALSLLATHLEELGLKGADLSLAKDITRILSLSPDDNVPFGHAHLKSSLRYIDLTAISSVTQMALSYSPTSLLSPETHPLEVIELSGAVLTELARRNKSTKTPEWTVKELGRRGWYVRNPDTLPAGERIILDSTTDQPSWKMGSRWWGMRKCPVIGQEVGGMYGYFMFKRN